VPDVTAATRAGPAALTTQMTALLILLLLATVPGILTLFRSDS
jgi:hypothetical protein